MSHGIRRRSFQVLPASGERITCVQYNEDRQATREWWEQSISQWKKSYRMSPPGPAIHGVPFKEWRFVLLAPLKSVLEFWASNDGLTGWMHTSGYLIPDHCRQTGGCPEVWNAEEFKGKKELRIANLAEIEEYVVLDHKQVTRSPFPEMSSLHASAR